MILVFVNGELISQIRYKTATMAKRQYALFLKKGIIDANTGEQITDAQFEII